MATVAQFNQDPNQQQQNQGGGGTVINSTGGGGATGVQGSQPSAGGGAYSPPRTPIAGAPNIQQYLNANQGAGQQLAGSIQGNVQNQANQLQQNTNTYNQSLQSQYYDPLQNQIGGQGAQQAISTAFQNPQGLLDAYNAQQAQTSGQTLNSDQQNALQNYNQYQQFQNLNNGSGYNQAISSYGTAGQQAGQQLQGQLSNLQQTANQANTEMGRTGLLQQSVGNANYNPGQQTLDSLLLQASPGVTNQLQQNLGGIVNQANQGVTGFGNDIQSKMKALQGLATQTQQGIQSQFGGELGNIAGNVANEYNTAKSGQTPAYQDATKAFTSNTFTPEQLKQFGLSSGQRTWGMTPEQIMNAAGLGPSALNAADKGGNAQVATPEEFARYNALNQLAGSNPGTTLQNSIFGSATQAGTYNPLNFNNQSLTNAINQRQQAVLGGDFTNAISGTQTALRNLSHGGYTNGMANDFAGSLGQAKTPQQAQQMVQQYIQRMENANGAGRGGLNNAVGDYSALNPFRNYYNSEFLPSATGVLGSNYNASNLPTMNMGDTYTYAGPGNPLVYNPIMNTGTGSDASTLQSLISSANGDAGSQVWDPTQGDINWGTVRAPQGK